MDRLRSFLRLGRLAERFRDAGQGRVADAEQVAEHGMAEVDLDKLLGGTGVVEFDAAQSGRRLRRGFLGVRRGDADIEQHSRKGTEGASTAGYERLERGHDFLLLLKQRSEIRRRRRAG